MVDHLPGALDLNVLIVVEHLVVVVDLPPGIGLFRAGGQLPAGLAEHPVLFDVDVPDPVQGGDLEIRSRLVPVHPHEQADDHQQDRQDDHQRLAGRLLRSLGSLLRGGFRRLARLFLLQHLEVIALGIRPAGAAVSAELRVVTVQGVAERAVPVRILADVFRLLFVKILDVRALVLFPGFPFGIVLHIELDVSPGPAAGGAVDHVPADPFGAAERTVPVSHDKL